MVCNKDWWASDTAVGHTLLKLLYDDVALVIRASCNHNMYKKAKYDDGHECTCDK